MKRIGVLPGMAVVGAALTHALTHLPSDVIRSSWGGPKTWATVPPPKPKKLRKRKDKRPKR